MAILSTSDLMYKFKIIFFALAILFTTVQVNAQVSPNTVTDNATDNEDIDNYNPDEAGVAMPADEVGIDAEIPIDDIIEGAGTILASGVYFRDKPNEGAKKVRLSLRGEKVLILAVSETWLKVRMYNNQDAYIMRKYVKMDKIFNDESIIGNAVDKKLYLEITDITQRFNEMISSSNFVERYHVVPILKLVEAKKVKRDLSITIFYSAVSDEGGIVPSFKPNNLQKNIITLVELVFTKLMLIDIDTAEVIVKVPNFAQNGAIIDSNKIYATLTLRKDDVNLKDITDNSAKLWKYIKTSVNAEKLFQEYPR